MLEIDGSHGEGGGQILRTSLALSVLTGQPIRIDRIRARRNPPGLKPQHLMSALSSARISNGRLAGAEIGAASLSFYPGPVQAGDHSFDVGERRGSAGAVSLIFQTLLPPLGCSGAPSRLVLKGGTDVTMSPSADYIRSVFLPTLAPMGAAVDLDAAQRGFYPIGGGLLNAAILPFQQPLKPLRIQQRGALRHLRLFSLIANLPISIAERQLHRMTSRLAAHDLRFEGMIETAPSPGKGTACFILAEFENVRAGFSALGAIGKRAEKVADEAVDPFLKYWNRTGALDPHLADQMALYMALAAGESAVTVSEVTEHLRTNLWVIRQFLPVEATLREEANGEGALKIVGAGWRP